MHRRKGSYSGVVLYSHVACESSGVGHDYVVANETIMRDMHVCHQQAVAADSRYSTAARSSAVDRHALADHIVVANLDPCHFAFELQVLRFQPDRRKGKYAIVPAHLQWAAQHDVGEQFAILSHHDL